MKTVVEDETTHCWIRDHSCNRATPEESPIKGRNGILTDGNWQKWKRVFLTCPCHKIYRDQAVGLKSCKYTWKITKFVKMGNLGQYHENLIFCQQLLNWSSSLKILLHMCDTYNCDYLKHSTLRFNLIDFQLNTDFPSQFCVFYRKIT